MDVFFSHGWVQSLVCAGALLEGSHASAILAQLVVEEPPGAEGRSRGLLLR